MKRNYIMPTIQVIELQHGYSILIVSGEVESASGPLNYRGSDAFYDEEEAR
jgi:hypothetical protein